MQSAFSVTPTSQNLNLNPGESVSGSILIANSANATSDMHYLISVVPYNVSGQEYAIDTSQVLTYSQIADWITIAEPTGVLSPNETRRIEFTINVPATAPGGSQTAALIVSPDTRENAEAGVSIDNVFQIASTIFANVSGETVQSGEILENNVPYFATSTPISASALFSNSGNVFEPATVQLTVTDNLTGQAILSSDSEHGNSYSEIILPETTRYVSRNLENLPAFGVVHVEQKITYAGQTSVSAHDLFIVPIWFMVLVVAIFAAIAGFFISRIGRKKRKKKQKSPISPKSPDSAS